MIKTIHDDIWNYIGKGYAVIIPTNGFIRPDGKATMGRGIALQAKKLYGKLEIALGNLIKQYGNQVFYMPKQRLIMFPTKNHWKEDSTLELIETSCRQLRTLMKSKPDLKVAMPKIGCGNGNLEWVRVSKVIEGCLSDFINIPQSRIVFVDNEQGDSILWRGKNLEGIVDDPEEKKEKPLMIDNNTGKTYNKEQLEELTEKEKNEAKGRKII